MTALQPRPDVLDALVDRAARGVASLAEKQALRQGVEGLRTELDRERDRFRALQDEVRARNSLSLEAWDAVETIRQRVKELRGRRGWTAAELGQRLTRLGVAWDRSIVANFETGRRRTIGVQELIALALVFDVAPVNLLVPVDGRPFQLTPDRAESSHDVRRWFQGKEPLPGVDGHAYRTEVSIDDLNESAAV